MRCCQNYCVHFQKTWLRQHFETQNHCISTFFRSLYMEFEDPTNSNTLLITSSDAFATNASMRTENVKLKCRKQTCLLARQTHLQMLHVFIRLNLE